MNGGNFCPGLGCAVFFAAVGLVGFIYGALQIAIWIYHHVIIIQ